MGRECTVRDRLPEDFSPFDRIQRTLAKAITKRYPLHDGDRQGSAA